MTSDADNTVPARVLLLQIEFKRADARFHPFNSTLLPLDLCDNG